MLCTCGSGHSVASCCQRLLSGELSASTAEQLMRSRFVAYASGNADYIRRTWHSSERPESLQLDKNIHWIKLQIIAQANVPAATSVDEDWVEFKASYVYQPSVGQVMAGQMHERSRFLREAGEWRYVDGVQYPTQDINLNKLGRNDLCFCGSGKKFKKCCAQLCT